ncbi:hypothetical protein LRP49_01915 [Enterovibrio sp. ZSDZ35]|uniref:Uncharacterized protein n=1 Tax=Enterovibrio qingdaonensis TaxID=2899818 RepID=A0ABT5QG40_9GAMM|nr:hypothetical protein [Enterovibrio sp. ZSDZ35]MDD1779942.1 hypothetical protein [Enterovibrio sp. ZSDZ35]
MLNNLLLSFLMVCFSSSAVAASSVTSKHAGVLQTINGDTIHEISINPLRKTLTIVADARAYKFVGLDEIDAKKLAERILTGKPDTTIDLSKYSR